jgi:predicted DNA-binding ribbon-helix-helix protein
MIRKDRSLPSHVLKRSINIGGHKTSVSLEDGFWRALREIAVIQNLRVSELVSRIAKDRQNKNISLAIRLFVLDQYRQGRIPHGSMMVKQRHEPSSPMTLGNLRQLGVRGLLVCCVNPQCRHEATLGVDDYEIELPSFAPRIVCSKCGGKVEVRPNSLPLPPLLSHRRINSLTG